MGTKTSMRTSKRRRANQQIASIRQINALGPVPYLAISDDWARPVGLKERLNESSPSGGVAAAAKQLNTTSTVQRAIRELSLNERDGPRLNSLSRELQNMAAFNRHQDTGSLPSVVENANLYNGHLGKLSEFQSDLKKAESLLLKLGVATNIQRDQVALKAFQREFSDLTEFERHVEKAKAFQSELDLVTAYKSQHDTITNLTEVMKRQAFMDARNENYQASLRLEGFSADPDHKATTLAELKAKYVR
jgi:hypothetical protein